MIQGEDGKKFYTSNVVWKEILGTPEPAKVSRTTIEVCSESDASSSPDRSSDYDQRGRNKVTISRPSQDSIGMSSLSLLRPLLNQSRNDWLLTVKNKVTSADRLLLRNAGKDPTFEIACLNGETLYHEDLGTVALPKKWVEASALNPFSYLLTQAHGNVRIMNTDIWTFSFGRNPDSVFLNYYRDNVILEENTILMQPVIEDSHFTLAVFSQGTISIFDSIFNQERMNRQFNHFKKLLQPLLGSRIRAVQLSPSRCPQQTNGTDCGIFLMLNMILMCKSNELHERSYDQAVVDDFRKIIAICLIKQNVNLLL